MKSATRWLLCGVVVVSGLLPLSAEAGRRRRCCCHAQPMATAMMSGGMSTGGKMVAAPTPAPAPAEPSLYERLGGEAAIKAVVDDFVGRAAGNPKVNFTRKGTDKEWAATAASVAVLKAHLVQLVAMVTGGP